MFLDYETLRIIWWLLLGTLIIVFAVLDGFDLGAAMLLPIIGKKDEERRIIINSVGPVWESNQVWLILGGGASFAAWPFVYSVSFSGLYLGFFLALFAIIIRPVGFKFRSKVENHTWRQIWDWGLASGGVVAPLIFGVVFGNLFLGLPFRFDHEMRMFYEGSFFQLLSPFPLLCGLLAVAMMLMQGATYLNIKTEGELQQRARNMGRIASLAVIVLFGLGGLYIQYGIQGYETISSLITDAASSPVNKQVIRSGTWLSNYTKYPYILVFPILTFFSLILTSIALRIESAGLAFLGSSIAIIGILATTGASLYPYIIPSSLNPSHGLTVWDASSSHLSLFIMFLSVLIFLPIVSIYIAWVYKVMSGKVNNKTMDEERLNAY